MLEDNPAPDKQRGCQETSAPVSDRQPYCKYFNTKEGCRFGSACKFRHCFRPLKTAEPVASSNEPIENPSKTVSQTFSPRSRNFQPKPRSGPVIPVKVILTKEQEGSAEQKGLRTSEITYFKRRYRYCHISDRDGATEITFKYIITEPDWVFDIKKLTLSISLPETYPISRPTVTVPEKKNPLPPLLRAHIEKSIENAVKDKYEIFSSRNTYENVAKNLLIWIDRNITSMFVDGLRQQKLHFQAASAGITLVSSKPTASQAASQVPSSQKESSNAANEEDEESTEHEDESDDESQEEKPITQKMENLKVHEPVAEYPLQLSLVWKNESQNIASITPVSLFMVVRCVRCREETNVEVQATGLRERRCQKCALVHSIKTHGEMIHENSSILAKLDCRGCQPVDLVLLKTALRFVCLECNKEDAVQQINYGLSHKCYCKNCHRLCEFVISVARFSGEFAKCSLPANSSSNLPKASKSKPVHVGPVITQGKPLPENGTCKHYKKSYRWFRFPCCGRAFPCDTCHQEANLGHEMKVANRMICGHCSTEQPFVASKPCSNCHGNVTRTHSRFWEGGKGCRDQASMSRNDSHKFSNSKGKTTPRNTAVTKKKTDTK